MRKTLEVINELKDKGLIKDYAIGGAIVLCRRWFDGEAKVDWQFTTPDARIKLKRLYPSIK